MTETINISWGHPTSRDNKYSFNIYKSMSRIWDLVNKLIIPHVEKIDPFENVVLQSDLQRLLIRSYWMDKIFGHIDTNKESQEKFSDIISIVVYNHQNQIEYVNDAYLKATWLASKEQIINLSKEWKLYEEIYEWDELERVLQKVSTLDDPRSWWYMNELFKMKKTGRILRWNTIKNRQRDPQTKWFKDVWNVRVAIDITDIEWFEELLNFERWEQIKGYGFVNTFLRFKTSFLTIMNSNPEMKRWVTKEEWQAFVSDLQLLEKISHIWDIIVDHGPLLVQLQHDREVFLNTRLMDITWYEFNELNEMLTKESYWSKLYWMKPFDDFTWDIENSNPWENIIKEMTLTRKGWTKMELLWNAIRFWQDWSQFWTWTVMSPMHKEESWKKVSAVWEWEFKWFDFDSLD